MTPVNGEPTPGKKHIDPPAKTAKVDIATILPADFDPEVIELLNKYQKLGGMYASNAEQMAFEAKKSPKSWPTERIEKNIFYMIIANGSKREARRILSRETFQALNTEGVRKDVDWLGVRVALAPDSITSKEKKEIRKKELDELIKILAAAEFSAITGQIASVIMIHIASGNITFEEVLASLQFFHAIGYSLAFGVTAIVKSTNGVQRFREVNKIKGNRDAFPALTPKNIDDASILRDRDVNGDPQFQALRPRDIWIQGLRRYLIGDSLFLALRKKADPAKEGNPKDIQAWTSDLEGLLAKKGSGRFTEH